jgi:nucleotide-binding universal stress UspA family protein
MTGATLRIVHVCDPWTKSLLAAHVEIGPQELVEALRQETARIAARRLAALAATVTREVAVETAVLAGEVTKAVAQDADECGAALVVIGARRGGAAQNVMGFSTAISLIMEGRAPVLIMNESAKIEVRPRGLRVMVCDDFSQVSGCALDAAFALCARLREPHLLHAHVETFGQGGGGRRARLAAHSLEPQDLANVQESAGERMRERAGDRAPQLHSAGGAYTAEVMTGSVASELERTANAARVDICVFGQHRVFHRETTHVGQMPFKAMLAQARAVIVVPCP